MRDCRVIILGAFLLAVFDAPRVLAALIVLSPPLNDTYISHDNGCTFNPCGADLYAEPDSTFSVATRTECARQSNSLLKFDLGAVASGAQIASATLILYAVHQNEYATNQFHVNRLIEDWSSGNVNWCVRSGVTNWSTLGGTYTAAGQSTITIPSKHGENPPLTGQKLPYEEWVSWDVTDIVQAWSDGEPNLGLLVRQTPQGGTGRNQEFRFASKESGRGPGYAARLEVELLITPVETSTWSRVKQLLVSRQSR